MLTWTKRYNVKQCKRQILSFYQLDATCRKKLKIRKKCASVENYVTCVFQIISAQCQVGNYGPGYGTPYPVYIESRGRDDLKYILPILMLLLTDGGFGGGCGGGGCCGNSGCTTFVPYPIPVPVNSPIVNC